MARGAGSGAAVHLCFLRRPSLPAQKFHRGVKRDTSRFSGMLQHRQLGWSRSSGWGDVQRCGQTAEPPSLDTRGLSRLRPARFTLFMRVVVMANEL